MGVFDAIANRLGYESQKNVLAREQEAHAKREAVNTFKRTFSAALHNRLTGNWSGSVSSINAEIEFGLPVMRNRSRGLVINNEYAARYMHMLNTHVVGPNGFRLQVRGGGYAGGKFALDTIGNSIVEQSFALWSEKGSCEVTGKLSFKEVCELMITGAARDGEYLVRKIRGVNAGPYGFLLQVLPIDKLDHTYRAALANGNIVRMGIEYDSMGKVAAYYLWGTVPNDFDFRILSTKRERVPADDIYHGFRTLHPDQIRGVPWMHPVMARLNMLHAYQDAAVVAARLGASKAGFFTTPENDGTALADAKDSTTGDLYMDVEPGVFQTLPAGYGFESWNPEYPHANQESFLKLCLRGIAGGINVAYNNLANDLEGVNFSSMRSGALEERDNWMMIQGWFTESFLSWVYRDWLETALLAKAIKFPKGSVLPVTVLQKFSEHIWQGRRWQWVDPEKDINANILAINNKLKSRTQIVAEQGIDFEDLMMQIKLEEEIAKANNVDLSPPPKPAAAPPSNTQSPAA